MPSKRGTIAQTSVDTSIELLIDTFMTPVGKTAWRIDRLLVKFEQLSLLPAGDSNIALTVTGKTGTFFPNLRAMAFTSQNVINTGAASSSFLTESIKEGFIFDTPAFAGTHLVLLLTSGGTGLVNSVSYEITYSVIKATDAEVLNSLLYFA